MRILALVGSPRKGGNTDVLVSECMEEGESRGHWTRTLYLYDFTIDACVDCRGCKRGDLVCVLQDDMREIYGLLDTADVVVFGTPVYWYGPSGKMKLLIDRLRPYAASGRLRGKLGMVVAPSQEGESCCGPMISQFRKTFDRLGMGFAGSVLAQANEKGEVRDDRDAIRAARSLAAELPSG